MNRAYIIRPCMFMSSMAIDKEKQLDHNAPSISMFNIQSLTLWCKTILTNQWQIKGEFGKTV